MSNDNTEESLLQQYQLDSVDNASPRQETAYDPSFFPQYPEGDHQQTEHEATANALNQLFNPNSEEDIDPTLASTIDAQHKPLTDNQGVQEGDGNLNKNGKRKATSRVNMLARGGACDFCKQRKLKCSADLPACAICIRNNQLCVYSQKKQRSKVKILEDRLAELERRLQPGPSGEVVDQQGVAFADSVESTLLETPTYHYGVPHVNSTFNLPEYDVDQHAAEPELVHQHQAPEPDLMTLADAAAGQDWPWEGIQPESIAREILNAVEGIKGGLGDKVISHLMSVYRHAGNIFFLSALIPAETLISRLIGRSDPRPQPSLLLSVICWLLSHSPSPDLSSPAHVEIINNFLQIPARTHSMQAMSSPDGRLMDAAIGDGLRAMFCYRQARFMEGWGEGARAAALAWAAGLGKLGGVGERFGGGSEGREIRVEREMRLRSLFHKGQVIEPARDAAEHGRRIDTFWNLFGQDQCSAIGWGWPSNFVMEEITTPLPKNSYETDADLNDNTTLIDFFDLSKPLPPQAAESDLSLFIKSQSILYRAVRQFDQSPSSATREVTSHLIAVAERHENAMPQLPSNTKSNIAIAVQSGNLNHAWMCLYTAFAYLYAKRDLDDYLESGSRDDDLPQNSCILSLAKVVEFVNWSIRGGDPELVGMTICTQTTWFVAASLAYRLHRRLISTPRGAEFDRYINETKRIGDELSHACRTANKKDKYGVTMAQLLENIAMGQDAKMGEWERPDNIA